MGTTLLLALRHMGVCDPAQVAVGAHHLTYRKIQERHPQDTIAQLTLAVEHSRQQELDQVQHCIGCRQHRCLSRRSGLPNSARRQR